MYSHIIVHILIHIVDIHEKGIITHIKVCAQIFVCIQDCICIFQLINISLSRIHKNAGEIFLFNSMFT